MSETNREEGLYLRGHFYTVGTFVVKTARGMDEDGTAVWRTVDAYAAEEKALKLPRAEMVLPFFLAVESVSAEDEALYERTVNLWPKYMGNRLFVESSQLATARLSHYKVGSFQTITDFHTSA